MNSDARAREVLAALDAAEPVSGWFEFWPDWLYHAPIVAWWILLGLRHGDQSLPTATNPTIPVGGLCGESKSAILDQVTPAQRGWIARWTVLEPRGLSSVLEALARAGLDWPVVAKPDIGCNGTGVRRLDGPAAAEAYLADFPAGARLMLQELVPWEGEAGLFYIRHPGEEAGRISSVTLKSSPFVTGDGRATLGALIAADPRARTVAHLLPALLDRKRVPAAGERVPLVFVGNHCKGSTFRDGHAIVTPALARRIDVIAKGLPHFHFGRLDVRYASLAQLRQGTGFKVIEINGVGSEPTHVWDPSASLFRAWMDECAHLTEAFAIGAAMRARGWRPGGVLAMLRMWRLQRRLMRSYPGNG